MADPESVELEARAKVNLRLRVLERAEDGLHGLETLFLRLELADRLELEAGGEPGIRLELEGEGAAADGVASVPRGPDNLAWQAVERFHEAAGGEPGVTLRLHKRIPAGAGLGGGSADAAAALRGMNELAGGPLSTPELLRVAGEVGSDVPFLAADLPAALAWGRGGRMVPVPAPPARPVLVAVPDVRIPSAEAYGWLDEDRAAPDEPDRVRDEEDGVLSLFDEELSGAAPASSSGGDLGPALLPPTAGWDDWSVLAGLAGNDFEAPVFARFPELGWWKEEMEGEGAELALLCGSGSALLGLFDDADRRDAAARRLEAADTVRVIRTRGPA